MPKHPRLMKRGNVFYHRASVPEDIRDTYGKTEETYSLKTRDPREALRLVRIEAARVDALFEAHREDQARLNAPPLDALTGEQVKTLADVVFAKILAEDEGERLKGFDDTDFDLYASDIDGVEEAARSAYARGTIPKFIPALFAETVKALNVNWRLKEGSPTWAVVSRAFLAATIKATVAKRQRQAGDVVETPEVSSRPTEAVSKQSQTITGLFELWKRDHVANGKAAKTVGEYKQKVDDFVAYLQHDDASKVSHGDIAAYCDTLRHERGLSAKTVNGKYLATIRTIYRLGKEKAAVTEDPTANMRVRLPKQRRERPQGFTDDEAIRILSASLRAPSSLGRMATHNKLAIRWVPWICAYTGARAGEITQLRREDFVQEHGIECIRITPEAGSVKTGQYRTVPLHPHLIELGILEFVKGCPAGPLFYLPNTRKKSNGHKTSDNTTAKVGEWVRDTVGITDPRIRPNHAWRHRFKTIARDVDIAPRYMDAIQGHDDGSASSDYGENTMKALYREIQKLPRYVV